MIKNINKRHLVIHPYCFATYIVLAPLAENIKDVNLNGIKAFIIIFSSAIFIVIISRLVFRDRVNSGLISSGFILLSFLYGHTQSALKNSYNFSWLSSDVFLLSVWVIIFFLLVYWVVRKSNNPLMVSKYLNWVGLILVMFPIFSLLTYAMKLGDINAGVQLAYQQIRKENDILLSNIDYLPSAAKRPDVYYIILDAYARQDILDDLYDYDNSDFISALEERNFIVATESTANYLETKLSIASSLNMIYLNTIPDYLFQANGTVEDWAVRQVASELTRTNLLGTIFRHLNYKVIIFDNGVDGPIMESASYYVRPPDIDRGNIWETSFELMVMDTPFAKAIAKIQGKNSIYQDNLDIHRQRILYNFAHLSDYAEIDGDFLIFAHIVSPHTPYVFDENGNPIISEDPYTLLDLNPGNPKNIALYTNQLHYINSLVLLAIDEILTNSDPTPIIIIQADHGSRVYKQLDPGSYIKYKLNVPILNAYHLPVDHDNLIYPSISPVNSFRLILNKYFGFSFDLLEDVSYALIQVDGRYGFVEACRKFYTCQEE